MKPGRRKSVSVAAALLALLMLAYAGVRSIVMQAAMAATPSAAMPMCLRTTPPNYAAGAMADMDAGPPRAPPASKGAPARGHRSGAVCPYCAAAAHVPVVGAAPPVRVSAAFVFSRFRLVASHGPRGPPACRPRARGPPADPIPL